MGVEGKEPISNPTGNYLPQPCEELFSLLICLHFGDFTELLYKRHSIFNNLIGVDRVSNTTHYEEVR